MKIEKIGTGSSIAEAYENAKVLLGAPDEIELHQEIIQDAKKKFLGLKIEPAKVKVWYEIPDKKEETAVKEKPVKKKTEQNGIRPVKKAPATNFTKKEETENRTNKNIVCEEISENDDAADYLKKIIEGMGFTDYSLSLTKNTDADEYIYLVKCSEEGALIGRKGETLDAIQYLLRLSINKGVDDDKHRRVSVNIGNYREKRNETLKALAARSANQALKYGRNIVLDPMNPYERRVIHMAIQNIEGVTSHSVGVDAGRRVVISLEEGVKPTHPARSGYGKGPKRERYKSNRDNRQITEPYKQEITREPRKDSAGSLYGKIEIPAKTEK